MERPIGYYVHHHGDGHRQRALRIAEQTPVPVTLLGTGLAGRTGPIPCLDLADDRLPHGRFDGHDGGEPSHALHYAPVDHAGIRLRVAQLTQWIAEARPTLLVVDVSVEVAMLARLASVPTIYVRLSGHRTDEPHQEAFRGALRLLAPFHADLEDDLTPTAIRHKTFYAPGLAPRPPAVGVQSDLIVCVVGRGGGRADGDAWAAAARAVPDRRWWVIGPCTVPADRPANLELGGWVDDPMPAIATAGVVVGAGGDGLVGSVIAARRPFLCIPEDRPFDEQRSKARQLARSGAAVVADHWPEPSAWSDLIGETLQLDPRVAAALDDEQGPARVGRWLANLVGQDRNLAERSA